MSEAINKVYAVECSAGSDDDYHTWIGGIFTNPEDAEKLKEELNKKAKQIQYDCPVQKSLFNPTIKEMNEINKYHCNNAIWMSWNNAIVKEYPLNKAIDF